MSSSPKHSCWSFDWNCIEPIGQSRKNVFVCEFKSSNPREQINSIHLSLKKNVFKKDGEFLHTGLGHLFAILVTL